MPGATPAVGGPEAGGRRLSHQRVLPAVQLLALPLYWLIGRHLLGLGPAAGAGFAAVAPFAVHTAVVGVGFALSYMNQHERRGLTHSRRRDWLVAYARETAESIRQFYWLMPFRENFSTPAPALATQTLPIVLVHGYGCNRGLWLPAARFFSQLGYRVSAISLEPLHGSIDGYAEAIAKEIARVKADLGVARVALIGHSMGGLAARAYLRHCVACQQDPAVAALITLGTPHRGTHLAHLARGENARQMRFDAAWIAHLCRHEADAGFLKAGPVLCRHLTTIGSLQDNIVTRQLDQGLPGIRAILVRRQGHMSLATSPRVLQVIDRLLKRASAEAAQDV